MFVCYDVRMNCYAENCPRPTRAKGLCNRHYENLRLRGSIYPAREDSVLERLERIGWTVVQRDTPYAEGPCWEWNGAINDSGYGLLTLSQQNQKHARVHRLVYETANSVSLKGQVILHKCDNPPCVNPNHLKVGTQADNINDMVRKRRHWCHDRTHCKNGHDLTVEGAIRKTKRENLCVRCDRDRKKRWEAKARALSTR